MFAVMCALPVATTSRSPVVVIPEPSTVAAVVRVTSLRARALVIVTNAVSGTWIMLCDSAVSSESSRAVTETPSAPAPTVAPATAATVAPVTPLVTSFAVAP